MKRTNDGRSTAPVIELRGVSKHFGGITAVDGVDLTVRRGEVHALVGENGAGKSTLMKILDGVHRPDAGTVRIDGTEVRFASVHDAERAGIAIRSPTWRAAASPSCTSPTGSRRSSRSPTRSASCATDG